MSDVVHLFSGVVGFLHPTADLTLSQRYLIGEKALQHTRCAQLPRLYMHVLFLCSNMSTPVRSLSVASLQEEEEEEDGVYEPVLLPPADYSDHTPSSPAVFSTPSSQNKVSTAELREYARTHFSYILLLK